jgi:hypothetical protein
MRVNKNISGGRTVGDCVLCVYGLQGGEQFRTAKCV